MPESHTESPVHAGGRSETPGDCVEGRSVPQPLSAVGSAHPNCGHKVSVMWTVAVMGGAGCT